MGECNAYKICRVILFVFNLLFFCFGLSMLGIGIYAKIHSTKYDDYLTIVDQSNSTWENFGSLLIAAGVICSVLGFSGLVGAAKENKACTLFFVILMTLIFIFEVVGAGLAYGYEDTIKVSLCCKLCCNLLQVMLQVVLHVCCKLEEVFAQLCCRSFRQYLPVFKGFAQVCKALI